MTRSASTILIVDDEIHNRKLLEALLLPEGYLTVSVASGEEALASIAQQTPDLILLDVLMPGMDGYELADILKADPVTASIPIIMVTALDDHGARLGGLSAGAEDFLTKPVERAELWLRVRNLLRLKALRDLLQNYSSILEQQVLARTIELQRCRSAMDATADAIFLVDRGTMRFVEVNATASHMLDYTREELYEMGPDRIVAAAPGQLESQYDALIAGRGTNELSEIQVRRKEGSLLPVEVHWQAQRYGADWIIVSVLRDITQRKEVEKRLQHLARYDTLTGLPNRRLFFDSLTKTLAQAAKGGWLVAVLCIDLDWFKNVNDTLGHAIGDELLCQFSNRLVECVRIRDTVGRLGGDEFALILVMQDNQQESCALVATKIREVLRVPFDLAGHSVSVTASIGISIHPDDASDTDTLMKHADTAMYQAKQAGRDTFRFLVRQ